MSGFNKNFKDGAAGLKGGSGNASGGFQSSEKRSGAGGGGSNSDPPVAFWDMEEGGTGTTVTDRSEAGNGLDLTLTGCSWEGTEKVRGSYSLAVEGGSDQAYIADNDLLDFAASDSFSISMWVKNIGEDPGSPGTKTWLAKMPNSGLYRGWELGTLTAGKIRFYLIDHWTGDKLLTFKTYSDWMNYSTTWHHVVVTYNGEADNDSVVIYHNNTALTYADGTLDDVVTDSLDPEDTTVNSNAMTMGSRETGLNAEVYFDDVAIFDYKLTADQVASIYNSGAGLDVSDGIPD